MFRKASPGRIGTLIFALAVAIGCGRKEGQPAEAPPGLQTRAVATTLPAGARVVVSGVDFQSFWSRLEASQLYKSLQAIPDVQDAMSPLAESRQEVQKEICVNLDRTTIMTLFGQRFDVGYYGPLPESRADLLLVADVKDEDQARGLVADCEKKLETDKGASFQDRKIAGTDVRVAQNRDGEDVLFYALGNGHLTIATTSDRMEQALTLGGGGEAPEPMTGDDEYVQVLRKLSEATLVVWVDQEALRQAALSAATADTSAEGRRMKAATSALEDVNVASSIGVGLWWTDTGIRGDSYALFPQGDRSEWMEMLTKSPGPVRSLSFQPEGSLLYTAVTSLDAPLLYDQLRHYAIQATRIQMDVAGTADSVQADSVVAAGLRQFQAQTGIDVEKDLVSWIGNEVAFDVAGVNRSGFFPLPEVAFTIATKDREKTRATLAKVEGLVSEAARARASIPLQWQEADYQGQTIRFAPTPLGDGLTIAYAVTPDFAIVASSKDLIQRMLDAGAGREPALPSNPDFGAMTKFYPDQANAIGFVNIERILGEVEDLMGTYGQMSGNAAAADSTSTPRLVMEAMKNAPRLGFYSDADKDGVFGHFLLEVK